MARRHYLWRAVDHEGEILESYVTKKRDKSAALRFFKKALKRHGKAETIVTDGLQVLPCSDARTGQSGASGDGPLAQQSGRELAPAVPTTRASDAAISTDEVATEVRLSPCQRPQPLQPQNATSSTDNLQNPPLGRPGRVAEPHGLKSDLVWRQLCRSETSCDWTDSTSGALRLCFC